MIGETKIVGFLKRHEIMHIKWIVTITAIISIIIHLIWPEIKIDGITFGLLLLAIAPWVSGLIKSIEIPGVGKIELRQDIDPDAVSPGGESEVKIKMYDSQSFFSKDGLKQLIGESGLVDSQEKVSGLIKIFSTERQHTWLIATNLQIFCILDDERTRDSGRLIQWHFSLDEATPVIARISSRGNPVLDIGPRKNWLYSKNLHPAKEQLEEEIKNMIDKARNA